MPFAETLLNERPEELRWLEVHPENYVARGGRYPATLRLAREHWPVVTHGLTMGFGGEAAIEPQRMADLAAFLDEVEAPFHSDHLSFCSAGSLYAHDLLPIAWTRASLETATRRIREMQDALRRPILFENLSYYLFQQDNELGEADFICELLDRTNAFLLLDVNNVYVNSRNHGFDAAAFLAKLPLERVRQIHVAGHLIRKDGYRIDTHSEPVEPAVHVLLEGVLEKTGPVPVLLERDGNFPPFDELVREVRALHAVYERATGAKGAGA